MRRLEWTLHEVGHCMHPECMVRRGGGLRPARFPSLVSRLVHPVLGTFLFDTGYASHFAAATTRWPERLYRVVTPVHLHEGQALVDQLAAGTVAGGVRGIVLSHLHADHVAGVMDFPDVPVWCSRAAMRDLRVRHRVSALRMGLLPALLGDDFEARCRWIEDMPEVPLPDRLHPFRHGHDLLGDGSMLAIALPGHAVGHYGLLFEDADGPVFLIADAAWTSRSLRENAPPPRVTTAWLGDSRRYRATFEMLRTLAARQPALRMVPSHCVEWRPDAR